MDLQSTSNTATIEKLDLQSQNQLAQGFPKDDGGQSLPEMESKLDTTKDPTYWSKLCLYNMAKLAKEATTVRRVLEPLFHNFDIENHWSSQKGVASSVLTYLQSLLAVSGDNSHLLLSILVKHLDHKNISKKPTLQIDIINITTDLAQNVKQQSSVAIIGAISDLIKHLRKCLQHSAESSSVGGDAYKLNIELQLQSAIERCILQLSNKVGDVGPILDLMAVVLENISTSTLIARTTISAVYQTAKLISSVPNVSYQKKAFPDALFHQLLVAMAHPDRETQIGAHSVFSMVLMPSMVSPWFDQKTKMSMKVQSNSFHIQRDNFSEAEHLNGKPVEGNMVAGVTGNKNAVHSYLALTDGKDDLGSLRLSSHQVSLLLSSIWVQATSVENGPANFEAMAHTFSICLLFTRSKASNYRVLARCFQLAFSLRSISLDQEGGLQPTRRRSLFTLASYMLMFAARAGNFPDLIPKVKSSLTEATVDPFLKLVDDIRLQAVCIESEKTVYGSQEDEVAAINSLSAVESNDEQLKEIVVSYFMTKFSKLSEDELSNIKTQILQGFSLDEAYPSGPSLFMETPGQFSPLDQIEFLDFDEVVTPKVSIGEESGPEPSGSQSDRRTSLSTNTTDVLSVSQLLESVSETARQVSSFSVSPSNPLPNYDQIKDQCEALVNGKEEKMSVLQSFKHRSEDKAIVLPSERGVEIPPLSIKAQKRLKDDLKLVSRDQVLVQQNSLRLPPSSPYDKFLRAVGS
ncbi:hypothetical protein PIB30_017754 [Stylosanthes scabra]|uniref:ARM repeat superfamily protein n=1 Tax=Stylosanthes scabra TaxID=79078 RepID=A0ABU6T7F1_9FABA|nr:hypothetical protein [Stylosanthes scabra]